MVRCGRVGAAVGSAPVGNSHLRSGNDADGFSAQGACGTHQARLVGEHDELGTVPGGQLAHYPADVGLDRHRADHQPLGDIVVREASRDEGEDLPLALGELVQAGNGQPDPGARCDVRDQPAGDTGGQQRVALGNDPDRPEQVGRIRILDQKSAGPGPDVASKTYSSVSKVVEDDHPNVVELGVGGDSAGRFQAVQAGRPDVHRDTHRAARPAPIATAARPSAASPTTAVFVLGRQGSARNAGRTRVLSSASRNRDHGRSPTGSRAWTRNPPPGRGPASTSPAQRRGPLAHPGEGPDPCSPLNVRRRCRTRCPAHRSSGSRERSGDGDLGRSGAGGRTTLVREPWTIRKAAGPPPPAGRESGRRWPAPRRARQSLASPTTRTELGQAGGGVRGSGSSRPGAGLRASLRSSTRASCSALWITVDAILGLVGLTVHQVRAGAGLDVDQRDPVGKDVVELSARFGSAPRSVRRSVSTSKVRAATSARSSASRRSSRASPVFSRPRTMLATSRPSDPGCCCPCRRHGRDRSRPGHERADARW